MKKTTLLQKKNLHVLHVFMAHFSTTRQMSRRKANDVRHEVMK